MTTDAKIQILGWVGGILPCLHIILGAIYISYLINGGIVAVRICWTSTCVSCLDSSASGWAT